MFLLILDRFCGSNRSKQAPDLGALKKQYKLMKQRQKQAAVILQSTVVFKVFIHEIVLLSKANSYALSALLYGNLIVVLSSKAGMLLVFPMSIEELCFSGKFLFFCLLWAN